MPGALRFRRNRPMVRSGALTFAAVGAALIGMMSTVAPSPAAGSPSASRSGNLRHAHITRAMVKRGYQVHGMALTQANRSFDRDLSAIPRLAREGINALDFYITEYQNSKTADSIHSGAYTPSAADVESAVRNAHRHGMTVELMPVVWTNAPFVWRGAYQPHNVANWFASYTKMIDRWATVARKCGAEFFAIGSEYQSLERYAARWRTVAASVKGRYDGETTYMATAGNYQNVKFWKSVDDIGLSPYFTLSRKAIPSVGSLVKAWQNRVLPALSAFSQHYDRRILLDEVGYQSREHTAYHPYSSGQGQPSEQAQANAYQAEINATAGQSYLRGTVFFGWGTEQGPPSTDRSYDPDKKLAECAYARSWSTRGARIPARCRR